MNPLVLLYGSSSPLQKSIKLQAGKLNLQYEAGFLRYIKVGRTEILRMINHYIRDENWATMPMTITNEKIESGEGSFSITYTAECIQGNIQFRWNCSILGKPDSSITFTMDGIALQSFKRNRLGFTILHPIETSSGKQCTILHSDNKKETFIFPERISPHQPFFDIAGMSWKPASGIEAELHFVGDIFETEDQRNWIDDSFKTYCTPLSKPFPVTVNKGDEVHQTIHFNVTADKVTRPYEEQLTFAVDKRNTTPFPKIGIPVSNLLHDGNSIDRIRELNIDFIRVEVYAATTEVSLSLKQAVEINLPLEIVLFIDKEFNLACVGTLEHISDRIIRIIVLPSYANCTDKELTERVVPQLRRSFPNCTIGGGTDAFFTELNRERTPPALLDFLSFSINPQAHASDIATLTENRKPQRDVVTSCRAFAEGRDIHVGPVTFKMRWNPNATTREEKKQRTGGLPISVDPRQLSLYGAAWMLGSIKYLAESNVAAVTYFETCGWKGLIPHREQPWPKEFLFAEESVYPVYIVLREILRHKHSRVAKCVSVSPLKVDGLAFVNQNGHTTILLANLTEHDQSVALPADLTAHQCRILNADEFANQMIKPDDTPLVFTEIQERISLPPFGFAMLEAVIR
jgi:D-apionolactonase